MKKKTKKTKATMSRIPERSPGHSPAPINSPAPISRESGFTLVEILIVMAIVGILASLVLLAMGTIQKQAKDKATEALVERLNLHISDYYRLSGKLPDDGNDTVFEREGVRLKGSAALYWQLTNPVTEKIVVAGEVIENDREPVAIFSSGNTMKEESIVYLIDAHGEKLHYDNLSTQKRNDPESDPGHSTEPDYGRWKYTVGFDSQYELLSIGMRLAEEDEGSRKKKEAEEEDEKYDF
jgi:prepilin-type N-terminal cleavage/methylation domain-containing protein